MSFLRREQMDCCNYVEAMGSKILVDSKSNWMHLESLEGNTTQVQTTGAQLFDIKNITSPQTVNGITLTTDLTNGTITVNGTATAVTIFTIPLTNIIPTGKIIYMGANNPVAGNSELQLRLMTEDESVIVVGLQLLTINTNIVKTLTNDVSKIGFRIGANQTVNNFVIKIMLAYDSAKPWEPYTGEKPSPSVEYPQDFVGADIKSIEVQGAQLFDISIPYSSINQWVITNDTISITNPTGSYLTVIYKIDCKPNTTYTIYSIIVNDVPDSNSMHIAISLLKKDGTTQDNIIVLNNTSSATFITTSDTQSIYIYFRNRTIGNGGYFKDIIVNEGKTALPWQPYYSPQNISITLTKPLYGIDNYNDEIAVTKRIDKCIEFTFNGSENWAVISTYEGFYYAGILPFTAMRRAGFCNQFPVDTKGEAIESIRIGNGNSVLFCVYSRFYDDTAADKGLAAWKAHLSTNPLKIVTYTNPEGYVETPLEQSNIDAIKSLYAYNGYTIVNNNENTNMKIMYKTKS